MGAGVGVILAATLSRDQLYAWGWRIPFLLGVLIAPVALYIRRQLPETIDEGQPYRSTGAVLSELMRHHSRAVVFGVLIICGGTVSSYVFNYMTTFAITTLHLSATIATALGVAGSVAQIAGLAVGVWLDRHGRKRMLILSRVIFVLVALPGVSDADRRRRVDGNDRRQHMFLNFLFAIGIGAVYAFMAEAFPQAVRSSGLAILYATGVMIFGGTTQFVVAWLIEVTKDPMVPAWYQIITTIASIVGILLLMPHAEVLRERAAHADASM